MVFITIAALYGITFVLALEYFGWTIASAWVFGFVFAVYEIFKFMRALRTPAFENELGDEL